MLDPFWKQFQLSVQAICNGDDERDLRFDVYDWNRCGNHEVIGSFHTSFGKLRRGACSDNVYEVINKKKQQKEGSKYKNSGTVILVFFQINIVPSFS